MTRPLPSVKYRSPWYTGAPQAGQQNSGRASASGSKAYRRPRNCSGSPVLKNFQVASSHHLPLFSCFVQPSDPRIPHSAPKVNSIPQLLFYNFPFMQLSRYKKAASCDAANQPLLFFYLFANWGTAGKGGCQTGTQQRATACPPFFHLRETAPRLTARFRNLRCVTLLPPKESPERCPRPPKSRRAFAAQTGQAGCGPSMVRISRPIPAHAVTGPRSKPRPSPA